MYALEHFNLANYARVQWYIANLCHYADTHPHNLNSCKQPSMHTIKFTKISIALLLLVSIKVVTVL